METYLYRCPVCGFIYQVPDYWVSFSPKKTCEFPHIDFSRGETCPNAVLELAEPETES